MSCSVTYSVVLRTLGYGGAKYQALLDSIRAQTLQPLEFLVVIPPEYELPPERLGCEIFLRTPKGMVRQRADGMRAAKGDYLLLVDDDISFPPTFAEELLHLASEQQADAVSPRMQDDAVDQQPTPSLRQRLVSRLTFGARLDSRPSPYALRLSRLGGTIRQEPLREDGVYLTQTGSGGCCLISRKVAEILRFEEEIWLEHNCRYAYPDDQVFFYKAHLLGMRVLFAHRHPFRHLDARSSLRVDNRERHCTIIHDTMHNALIYWHRLQWQPAATLAERCLLLLVLPWRVSLTLLMYLAYAVLHPRSMCYLMACLAGYRDAVRYLRSEDYARLPRVRRA